MIMIVNLKNNHDKIVTISSNKNMIEPKYLNHVVLVVE